MPTIIYAQRRRERNISNSGQYKIKNPNIKRRIRSIKNMLIYRAVSFTRRKAIYKNRPKKKRMEKNKVAIDISSVSKVLQIRFYGECINMFMTKINL